MDDSNTVSQLLIQLQNIDFIYSVYILETFDDYKKTIVDRPHIGNILFLKVEMKTLGVNYIFDENFNY